MNVPVTELYDLKADIGETTNVADKHPEVVARLRKLAEKAQADLVNGDRGEYTSAGVCEELGTIRRHVITVSLHGVGLRGPHVGRGRPRRVRNRAGGPGDSASAIPEILVTILSNCRRRYGTGGTTCCRHREAVRRALP